MRLHRLVLDEATTYHVMSRVIEHRFIFGDSEKSHLSNLMRRLEGFTGCEVRTYAFMDNHFHILLHVPQKKEITDEEVKRRASILYDEKKYAVMEQNWEFWVKNGRADKVKAELDGFRVRMYDLSQFMKTFKQRISIYYNANHNRRGAGPLWHDRFKSTLVEGQQHAQMTIAAYIDLNPVRAGVVNDPKDYRWSGYAEAIGRGGPAFDGIASLFSESDLTRKEVLSQYRQLLYCEGVKRVDEFTGAVTKPGFDYAAVDKILEDGGELSIAQFLNCKVRYFSDGVIIGSKVFIERMLAEHTDQFSELRRRRGATKMKHGASCGLCSAGDLRSTVVSSPA